jgi:FkbM family methyltransferase
MDQLRGLTILGAPKMIGIRGLPTYQHKGQYRCNVQGFEYKFVNGVWIPNTDPSEFAKGEIFEGVPGYQRNAVMAALTVCPGRCLMIDAGAHVGLLALQFHAYFQHVHAFEPLPTTFDALEENVRLHLNFEKFHPNTAASFQRYCSALSDHVGTLRMGGKPNNNKSFSWMIRDDGPVEVKCRTIDTLELQTLDLIKLDIEGHELQALKGGEHTIRACRPVILIEEKFDEARLSSKWLMELGMIKVWRYQYDMIWVWPEHLHLVPRERGLVNWIPEADLVLPPVVGAEGTSNNNNPTDQP